MLAPIFASQVDRVSDGFHHSLGGEEEVKGTPFHRVEKSIFLIGSLPLPLNHPLIPPPTSASILNR